MTCNMTCLINNWSPGTDRHVLLFKSTPRAMLLVRISHPVVILAVGSHSNETVAANWNMPVFRLIRTVLFYFSSAFTDQALLPVHFRNSSVIMNPLDIWWDSLCGGSARRKASTYTGQHNAERREHTCLKWDSNPWTQSRPMPSIPRPEWPASKHCVKQIISKRLPQNY
jgi:hypothetical protein